MRLRTESYMIGVLIRGGDTTGAHAQRGQETSRGQLSASQGGRPQAKPTLPAS